MAAIGTLTLYTGFAEEGGYTGLAFSIHNKYFP